MIVILDGSGPPLAHSLDVEEQTNSGNALLAASVAFIRQHTYTQTLSHSYTFARIHTRARYAFKRRPINFFFRIFQHTFVWALSRAHSLSLDRSCSTIVLSCSLMTTTPRSSRPKPTCRRVLARCLVVVVAYTV